MATRTATITQSAITLRGSAEIVTEFFGYSINRCVTLLAHSLHAPLSARLLLNLTVSGCACLLLFLPLDSILYQRGLYDASTFIKQSRYGLGLQVTADPTLSAYLQSVLAQLRQWLERGEVKRLVLVIANADTEEVVERWVFNVQTDRDTIEGKQT